MNIKENGGRRKKSTNKEKKRGCGWGGVGVGVKIENTEDRNIREESGGGVWSGWTEERGGGTFWNEGEGGDKSGEDNCVHYL